MRVAELWRYSVKSLRGERLSEVDVLADGLRGDRASQVVDYKGNRVTGRTAKALLGLQAGLDGSGEPTVNGHAWASDEARSYVQDAVGPGATLAPLGRHFDAHPILVVTDGAVAALGEDVRRLRPNVVVAGVEGLADTGWVGATLRLGQVELEVVDQCERCVMTTIDPDTLEIRPEVLRRINDDFGRMMGVLCEVRTAGPLREGDEVEITDRG